MNLTKISEAIQSKTPPIGLLTKVVKNGDVLVKGLIVNGLTDLAMFVNVSENANFNTLQITQTTELILEDFKHLKIEDFKLFFNKVKKGHYGKLFNRLDGQVVMEQLHVYCHERSLEAEHINFRTHSEQKQGIVKVNEVNPEGQKKVISILSDIVKKSEVVKVEKPIREKTDQQKLIQRFLTEFDKLWSKKAHDSNGGRFIKRYGRVINQVEYIEYKLNQIQIIKKRKK